LRHNQTQKDKMKHHLLLTASLIFALHSTAQEAKSTDLPLHIEASLAGGTSSHDVQPFDASLAISYYPTSRFSIDVTGVRDFYVCKNIATNCDKSSYNLGGGLGYVLFKNVVSSLGSLELRANVTSTIGSSYFKNVTYSIGLNWYDHSSKRKLSPLVGIGYKAYDFSDKSLSTHHGAYISLGLRF
jgi:hypothetical protein